MAEKISKLDLDPSFRVNQGSVPPSEKHPDNRVMNDTFKAIPDTNSDSNLRVIQKKPCKRESTRAALLKATKELVMERGKEKNINSGDYPSSSSWFRHFL